MPLVQCNYPGCQEHSEQRSVNAIWDCGKHKRLSAAHAPGCALQVWSECHRYLPSRHPHRKNAPACDCGKLDGHEAMVQHSAKFFSPD